MATWPKPPQISDFAIMTLYLAMSFLCAMTTQFVSLKVTERKLKSKEKEKKGLGFALGLILNSHWHEL